MSPIRSLVLLLACVVTVSLSARTLTYENLQPDAERQLSLRRDGERLVLTDERARTTVASAPAATTDRVVIRGAAGERRDTLRIDFSQPIVLSRGIDYDGGAGGWDVLELAGGSARTQQITQLTPHDGIIDIDGLVIRYANLEPITDTASAANFTINGTAGTDTVSVTDGPGGTTTVSAPTFESVTFANKTNVVFDGIGGDDVVTFNNPNPATGLASFIVTNVHQVTQTYLVGAIRYPSFGVNARDSVVLNPAQNDVDRLEITSQNGEILFLEADDVILGGVSPALAGLRVVQSGGIRLISAAGTITLADTDAAEIVRAGATAGNVMLSTHGGDVVATVNRQAIIAPAGDILAVGVDILLGTLDPAFANDVRGRNVTLNAIDEVRVAGQTTIQSDSVGAEGLITLYFVAPAVTQSQSARFSATGAEALLRIHASAIHLLGPGVESLTGDVDLWASEVLDIAPASGVSAPEGMVTVSSFTNDQALGVAADAPGDPLEVSDAEVDRIVAPALRFASRGAITITAPITFTTGSELIVMAQDGIAGPAGVSAQIATFILTNTVPSTWTATPASVQIDGATPVPYTATTLNLTASAINLAFTGGTANDTFFVTPSPTTTINVDGNMPYPPASPGDTLDFDLTFAVNPALTATLTAVGYQGSLTSSNLFPVNFQQIERLVDAPVDLGITKTDGATFITAGSPVTYTIVVSNAAPIPVAGATVADTFPPELTGVSWTCSASSGSSCTGAGSGNLNDTITLAANGSVTYTVTGTTSPSQTGTLSNTVTVTTPAGYLETNAANNTATDTTTVVAAPAGIPTLSPMMLVLLAALLAFVALRR